MDTLQQEPQTEQPKEHKINGLQLKALMLDTITYLKHGHHLHPNYKSAKYLLCDLSGQKRNINSRQLLTLIGLTYMDNGPKETAAFWATIDKFDAEKYLIQE